MVDRFETFFNFYVRSYPFSRRPLPEHKMPYHNVINVIRILSLVSPPNQLGKGTSKELSDRSGLVPSMFPLQVYHIRVIKYDL